MTPWYLEKGPEGDVVVSTRVRLARNFQDMPFPVRMRKEQGVKVIEKIQITLLKNADVKFNYISMQELGAINKQAMMEKHLISPEMLQDVHSRGVFLNKDESISIMLNEEDHLRVQCLFSGMQLQNAWKLANKIDNILEQEIEYAYNEQYGYLTCCPTNTGTGLRASVMIHLPALTMTGYLNSLLTAVGKLGLAVRGLYGEGTEARGHIFQISNQVTLGISEEETIENLKGIVKQIIEKERVARQRLLKGSRLQLEDRLYRSYGVFRNARIMTSEEFMKFISDVRLGIYLDIIKDIQIETVNELMIATQPANIMLQFGETLSAEQRDIKRAEIIRKKIKS